MVLNDKVMMILSGLLIPVQRVLGWRHGVTQQGIQVGKINSEVPESWRGLYSNQTA
jgi:hypothetical protein